MADGIEIASRVDAIGRSQRVAIAAVDAVHGNGQASTVEYVTALDRAYTDAARTLRDNKADVVRALQRIERGATAAGDAEAEEYELVMSAIDEQLDAIVGIKAAFREMLRTLGDTNEPSPDADIFAELILDALRGLKDRGIIQETVFNRAYARLQRMTH